MKLIYFIYDDLLYLCIQLFVDQHLFVWDGSVVMLLQVTDFLFADGSGPMTGERVEFKFKLSFIVIPLHVGTYSGTKCRASQDHGAT